ncbi:MAG: crosslink repair DNA glycosylase YcaQ family protein [Flaviflexus sp.]|nr:crosslink repair DNA glycosylase YcaQ family protein [Flaviflexus sp.]
MVAKHVVLSTEIGFLRMCAQSLAPGTSHSCLGDVVPGLLAMQGQQVSAVPHALAARSPQATGSEVAALFNSRMLVRHRPMRGTVHITAAKDLHWMRVALKSGYSSWDLRHHTQLGIDSRVIDKACAVAWEEIENRGGQMSRADLFDAWTRRLQTKHLDGAPQLRQWCTWLMYATMREGAIVEGPAGKNQHLFIDVRQFPACDSAESGWVLSPDDREGGIAEVARCYIHGHGPITVADLAWWAGLSKTVAAGAIHAAIEADPSIGAFDLADAGVPPRVIEREPGAGFPAQRSSRRPCRPPRRGMRDTLLARL